jgi:hypothetical protein
LINCAHIPERDPTDSNSKDWTPMAPVNALQQLTALLAGWMAVRAEH